MIHRASWADEHLLRRPSQEDRRYPTSGHGQERDHPLLRFQPLLGEAVCEDGPRGKTARPKESDRSVPNLGEGARRLSGANEDALMLPGSPGQHHRNPLFSFGTTRGVATFPEGNDSGLRMAAHRSAPGRKGSLIVASPGPATLI